MKDKKICDMCKQESSSDHSTKIYTRQELVMMKTTISDFHNSFYIPAIQTLVFLLPHVSILGKNHCSKMRHTEISIKLHHHVKVMKCFTLFYLTTANRILALLLHTEIIWFNLSKRNNYWRHNWLQYGKTLIVVPNNIDVPLHCT